MKPNNPTRAVIRRLAVPCAAALLTIALPATALAAEPVRLAIDPGHGGKDPGAVWGGVQEKKTNLAISRMVAESAKRQGWAIKMTRNDDRFIPLPSRPAKATAFKATATVSVHSNSAGSKKTGNMTIYRDTKSKRLGRNIMDNMAPLTDYADIGNKPDSRGLAVLRGAKNPTVIVEVLSVSNKEENRALRDPKQQRAAAEAIVKGVASFHGVEYKPATEPKPVSTSKAPAPATEATEPVKATLTAEKPSTAPSAARSATTTPAEKPATAPKPDREARTATGDGTAARSTAVTTDRAPIGDASWFGRVLRLFTR